MMRERLRQRQSEHSLLVYKRVMRVIAGNGTIGAAQSSGDELIRRIRALACESKSRHSKARTSATHSPSRRYRPQAGDVATAINLDLRVILRRYQAGNVQYIVVRIADLELDTANSLTNVARSLEVLKGNL